MEVYATTNMDFTVICIQNIELWPYEIKLCFTFCHLSWVSWVIFLVPEVEMHKNWVRTSHQTDTQGQHIKQTCRCTPARLYTSDRWLYKH